MSVYGPSALSAGASATYNASMAYGCTILIVDWTATNGASVQWLPGSGSSFQLTARVAYAFDWISTGRKTIAIQ